MRMRDVRIGMEVEWAVGFAGGYGVVIDVSELRSMVWVQYDSATYGRNCTSWVQVRDVKPWKENELPESNVLDPR